MEALLARYRPEVEKLSRQVVAVLRDSLPSLRGEYPLGNLIADAQRAAAPGIDFALMNNGGIRRDLYPGPLTYNDLFELQPFGNSVLEVWLSGRELKDVLEHALAGGTPDGHVSGLIVRYDSRRPVGERVVELRRSDGRPVEPGGTYTMAVSDFLQAGGAGYAMLRTLRMARTGKTDLDALIAWLRLAKQPVTRPTDRRFLEVAQ